MHQLGLTYQTAATLLGRDVATLRRWRTPARPGACHRTNVPRHAPPIVPALVQRAEALVRRLHGLVGAQALSHSVPGLSRRAAAAIKARVLTTMERERKAALVRVQVTQPAVLRGLDAMQVATLEGPRYALISADAAIPYRTMLSTALHYDAQWVAHTVAADFESNGAPLVLRLDRARAHDAPAVRVVLERYGVLMLHGPAHCARFYGQLERQNREHRAWLNLLQAISCESLDQCLQEMLDCVNRLWRRRTLHWRTAAEVWNARPALGVDRDGFRQEVLERAGHIARTLEHRGHPADWAERFAIERTLEHRGYLRQQIGGWC